MAALTVYNSCLLLLCPLAWRLLMRASLLPKAPETILKFLLPPTCNKYIISLSTKSTFFSFSTLLCLIPLLIAMKKSNGAFFTGPPWTTLKFVGFFTLLISFGCLKVLFVVRFRACSNLLQWFPSFLKWHSFTCIKG